MIKIFFCPLIFICLPVNTVAGSLALPDPTWPETAPPVTQVKQLSTSIQKKKIKKKQVPRKLILQQTIVSEHRQLAVINGKTFTQGEYIDGVKITQISPGKVMVFDAGKIKELNVASSLDIKEADR